MLGAGALDLLDVAEPHAYRQRVTFGDQHIRCRRAAPLCVMQQRLGDLEQRVAAHAWVPPTVIASMRMVGSPTPTGTDWPSLPHVPMPSSRARSLPTIETCVSASGPLPINVAPFTG